MTPSTVTVVTHLPDWPEAALPTITRLSSEGSLEGLQGRLVQRVGEGYRLELSVALSLDDGDAILSEFLAGRDVEFGFEE